MTHHSDLSVKTVTILLHNQKVAPCSSSALAHARTNQTDESVFFKTRPSAADYNLM